MSQFNTPGLFDGDPLTPQGVARSFVTVEHVGRGTLSLASLATQQWKLERFRASGMQGFPVDSFASFGSPLPAPDADLTGYFPVTGNTLELWFQGSTSGITLLVEFAQTGDPAGFLGNWVMARQLTNSDGQPIDVSIAWRADLCRLTCKNKDVVVTQVDYSIKVTNRVG